MWGIYEQSEEMLSSQEWVCCMKLFSPSVSRLSYSVKIEQINGKIDCLTDYIIRVILFPVHIIHQNDNIIMDCRERECEDVKWIQLMQPMSVVNVVLNVSVAWEHKLLDCMYCVKELWRQKISVLFQICVFGHLRNCINFSHIERLIFYHRSVLL